MTEHPILFSAPMVRAILDGKKTQTRRVVKRQPGLGQVFQRCDPHGISWDCVTPAWTRVDGGRSGPQFHFTEHCPYGQPGDRLWVRESFAMIDDDEALAGVLYRADGMYDGCGPGDFAWTWKPSIHMPRWASRITLELTDVRVQRLQDITPEDCYEEGLRRATKDERTYKWGCDGMDWADWRISPIDAFHGLWDSINAKRNGGACSWQSNPWVWALTFRRVGRGT